MTNSERALVPVASSDLPTHIERRTRIANRVLGELERRDTEAFFRRHPEFFRLVVSQYYPLDEALIDRHAERWDWGRLSENAVLPWTEAFIDRYAERWWWDLLSVNKALPWSEVFIDRYTERWDWKHLSWSESLTWRPALIDRYAERWNWKALSENTTLPWNEVLLDRYAERWWWKAMLRVNKALPWGEAFIIHYAERWSWKALSWNPGLPWSEAFIDRYAERWNWGTLSWNAALPWSKAFFDRYAERWNWGTLSWNPGLPWSEAFIDRYAERWNWGALSENPGLPWSEAFIDRYAERWNWGALSENPGLPWSEAFIDRYAERWNWGALSWNVALPWSKAFFDRYAERWDVDANNIDSIAIHYDGNVRSLMPEQIDRLMRFCFPVESPQPLQSASLISSPPALQPFTVFHDRLLDGSEGPVMIVIPAGEFWMGSPKSKARLRNNERRHQVEIAQSFAIASYTVTFDEYNRFCTATGRKNSANIGWGRGCWPVIHISWYDAVDYTEWLSAQTDRLYRLPTEAEWEYACRAGTGTAFWWGNGITTDQANYRGGYSCSPHHGRKGIYRKKTVPVNHFQPNPWGLYQVHGNVWEWTSSCYDRNYGGTEMLCADKSESGLRAVRGGSWDFPSEGTRSAFRGRFKPLYHNDDLGFRIVRSL